MVAVEPRKRKFHQPIFVSIPLPCNPSKINENTNIRLLCSGELNSPLFSFQKLFCIGLINI